MSDQITLAGTIGTWVAVFLAIVALAGILPAYLLVRSTRRTQNLAIAAINDPLARFVFRGFGISWLKGLRKVRVPDVKIGPTFDHSQPPQLQEYRLQLQPVTKEITSSGTGWINFAYLLEATFSDLKYKTGTSALTYRGTESYLPLHGGWLLLLGILNRCACREDLGLPVGTPTAAELEMLDPTNVLSGLCGVISGDVRADCVRFRMHETADLHLAITQELVPLSSLCFLFASLLPSFGGVYLNIQKSPPTRATHSSGTAALLQLVVSRDLRSFEYEFLRWLNLRASIIRTLMPKRMEQSLIDQLKANGASSEWNAENVYVGWITLERHDSIKTDCWLVRDHLHQILLAYLDLAMSPKSFLYNSRNDLVLRHVVRAHALKKTIQLSQKFVHRLDVKESTRETLREKLEIIGEREVLGVGWSRTELKALWELDNALSELSCLKSPKGLTMSMIYMHDCSFQDSVCDFLQTESLALLDDVLIDLDEQVVRLPGAEHHPEKKIFPFDFSTTFKNGYEAEIRSLTNQGTCKVLSYSLIACFFACLRGHTRVCLWRLTLKPSGLSRFLNSLHYDAHFVVSATTRISIDEASIYGSRSSSASSDRSWSIARDEREEEDGAYYRSRDLSDSSIPEVRIWPRDHNRPYVEPRADADADADADDGGGTTGALPFHGPFPFRDALEIGSHEEEIVWGT